MTWPQTTAESIALPGKGSIVSGPFGSNISARFFVDEGVPVIRGNNLTTGVERFKDGDFVFLTETKAQEFRNCEAVSDDLVFTAAGTIGQVGIISKQSRYPRYIVSNKQLRLRCDQSKVDPLFLYYWFSSPIMTQYIINRNSGSSVPLINLTILRRLPVPEAPVHTQRRIAAILSAYDDLIENNRRRIQLLEQAARLIYQEWFVRLRFPGHEHARVVDGAPERWEKRKLGDILVLNYGKGLKESERSEGDVPVYGSSGVVGSHHQYLVEGPGIIVGRKGNVGSVFWSQSAFFPIDTVYYVDSKTGSLYLFHLLQSLPFQSSDGAVPGLNRNYAYSLPVLVPPTALVNRFEGIAGPIYQQILNLQRQNERLRQARDLLLPKLMSGEIEV
jgi:type I restriction enzyme S subunit